MFYHIEGNVAELQPNLAVLDCGGIGFALNATSNTVSALKVGEKARLFVAEAIGENNFDLYGFVTKSEKRCFEQLITVSGIGPKAALSILSYNTPDSLALSVLNDDVKALTVAPGIGKKIAQRVILELKDKLSKDTDFSGMNLPLSHAVSTDSQAMNDALSALAVLGYSSAEVAPILKALDCASMSAEEIIKAVMKQMMQ